MRGPSNRSMQSFVSFPPNSIEDSLGKQFTNCSYFSNGVEYTLTTENETSERRRKFQSVKLDSTTKPVQKGPMPNVCV